MYWKLEIEHRGKGIIHQQSMLSSVAKQKFGETDTAEDSVAGLNLEIRDLEEERRRRLCQLCLHTQAGAHNIVLAV